MKIKEIMSKDIIYTDYNSSLKEAAILMLKNDIGFLPVKKDKKIIGCLTDRDITIYGIANDEKNVRDIMKNVLITIDENNNIIEAIKLMKTFKIRRLIVKSNKKISGIISISDIINSCKEKDIIDMLKSILRIDKNHQEYLFSVKDFEL